MPFGVEEIREFGAGMAFVLIFWMGAWMRGKVFSEGAMTAVQEAYGESRSQYEVRIAELTKDKDEYKAMVFRTLNVTERATSLAEEREQ